MVTEENSHCEMIGTPGTHTLGDLSAKHKEFVTNGWTVIPNVLDEARTEEVLDKLWWAAAESERRDKGSTFISRLDPNASNVGQRYILEH
jgi:hypothetical protein